MLVESPWTFSGKEKPLYYSDNKSRFEPWKDKIRVVVPQGEPKVQDPWYREYLSREMMAAGLSDAAPDDLIFQSDVDEIWRPEKKLAGHASAKVVVYDMYHAYYYLNTPRVPPILWKGTRRLRAKDWNGGQKVRQVWGPRIEHGGWHFSFLGDAEHAKKKLEAYAHTEYSGPEWTDPTRIGNLICDGVDLINPNARYEAVPVDDTFPKPVLEDMERWRQYIRPC